MSCRRLEDRLLMGIDDCRKAQLQRGMCQLGHLLCARTSRWALLACGCALDSLAQMSLDTCDASEVLQNCPCAPRHMQHD